MLGPIYQTMAVTNQNQITFTTHQTSAVIKEIVALLDYPRDVVNVDKTILNTLEKAPLIIESYFDFKGKEIILRPIFRYGTITIDLLNKTNDDSKIVLRDIYQEQQYLTLLKQIGFVKKYNYLILNDLNYVIKLLSEHISTLETLSQIFYTDNFKNVRLVDFNVHSSTINVNQKNNWLEFEFQGLIMGINIIN